MIDFRYHLVSLMAVLIALTMGVVLGAGPLRGTISDSISGEVDRLSQQQVKMQAEKENLITQLKSEKSYLADFSSKATKNALAGEKVAIVQVNAVSKQVLDNQVEAIENAGAKVVANVTMTSSWTSTNSQSYRDALASTIKDKLPEKLVSAESSSTYLLSVALAKAATDTDDQSKAIREELTAQPEGGKPNQKLVNFTKIPTEKATLILVLAPTIAPPEDGNKTSTLESKQQDQGVVVNFTDVGLSDFSAAFSAYQNKGLVFLGDADDKTDTVAKIRRLKLAVSSVDSIGNPVSSAVMVLAEAASLHGNNGAYGTQTGATAVIPEPK